MSDIILDTAQPRESSSLLDRVGIPRPLALGFLGVLLFMIGDGVESGYLSPYLISRGFSEGLVALMFTLYGLVAAIFSWCSGALSDLWGPRQVMLIGAVVWAVLQVIFLIFGIGAGNYAITLTSYTIRGIGYPLFAYGFLVWIAAATPPKRLGSAVGWFWFAFTGGLPTLGALLASFVIPVIGAYNTLWVALGLVVLGALIALLGVRERIGSHPLAKPGEEPLSTLLSSITIAWKKPKTAIGCIVRAINTAPELGFLIFLPIFFTETIGFSLDAWLRLLSFMFLSNIIWNLLFGIIGDKLGWRQTVAYCGGVGCAITTLLLYYVPLASKDYSLSILVGVLYGATLAGYVPLSALMPSLAPENKGAAMSLLNLGAGASAWLGPAIVGIFLGPLGVVGVMWIYAVLYVISAILALFLTLPPEVEAAITQSPERRGISGAAFSAGSSLLGHPPSMPPQLKGESDIDLVLFDLGGVIYDDNCYALALLQAVKEINPQVKEIDFWAVVDAQLGQSEGSLRTELSKRFNLDRQQLNALARQHWNYPASALLPRIPVQARRRGRLAPIGAGIAAPRWACRPLQRRCVVRYRRCGEAQSTTLPVRARENGGTSQPNGACWQSTRQRRSSSPKAGDAYCMVIARRSPACTKAGSALRAGYGADLAAWSSHRTCQADRERGGSGLRHLGLFLRHRAL
jgi:polyol permease family